MSATLTYQEPYRFSAGALAVVVHLAFFSLLYFGVRWQSQPDQEFAVEMWSSLPNAEVAPGPPPAPAAPAPPVKVVAPPPPVKAEIEVREKKSRKVEVKEKPAKKNEAKEKAAAKARQEAERKELEKYDANLEQRRNDVREQARKEANVATQVQVERYQDKIRSKIRSKIIKVADVPENAEVIYKVTLLPGGMLMDDPVLLKSSGIPAYDAAVARAILLAEPLPVPDDVALQKMFRELKLSIRP